MLFVAVNINISLLLFQEDQEKILDTVLEESMSAELITLTDVIGLLFTVVQEPWRDENKMSGYSLGIAVALSFFPELDPGRATFLTQYLITNYETLRGSHTML